MDREKVIKGLKICVNRVPGKYDCNECPYEIDGNCCEINLAKDILALLEEQEIGHWILLENCSNSGVYCSGCHTKVFDNYPFKKKFSYFCPHCGTRMEGEIERR